MRKSNLVALVAIALLLAACGGPKTTTTQIWGTVTDASGLPAPGIRVLLPGKSIVTTDVNGRFSFDGVTVPYTLIVERESHKFVVYQGIQRTDPQVFTENTSGIYSTGLQGTVANTTAGNTLGLQLASAHAIGSESMESSAIGTETSYSFPAFLLQPVTRGTLHALEWSQDASHNAQDFSGYGVYGDVDLAAGGSISNVDLDLAPVPGTHDLDVTVEVPSGLDRAYQLAGARFAGALEYARPLVTYRDGSPSSDGYTVRSPDLDAAQMVLAAAASRGANVFSVRWQSVPSSTTAHTLTLRYPVELLDPPDGAGVAADATFRWNAPSGALSLVYFSGDLDVRVYTAGRETTLVDLSPFGVSYGSNPYSWSVVTFRLDRIV